MSLFRRTRLTASEVLPTVEKQLTAPSQAATLSYTEGSDEFNVFVPRTFQGDMEAVLQEFGSGAILDTRTVDSDNATAYIVDASSVNVGAVYRVRLRRLHPTNPALNSDVVYSSTATKTTS